MYRFTLTLFCSFVTSFWTCNAQCGYKSCNPTLPGKLNVHMVPHTHDDVGWLKTVDEYYYGANNSIQHAGVQYILDSVIAELDKDPARRFIYVEIAFFERWWREQNDAIRHKVKKFVQEGRLEFINGGWSMNDEACTHYSSIIDQMTLGHHFLNRTFGDCARPRIAWHIDPFGHSREQASLFAQMGFDGFFFARITDSDRKKRHATKTMEQIWQANPSLGHLADMMTGVLYIHYDPPKGFCFDQVCRDAPIQDDQRLFDYNLDERVDTFVKLVVNHSLAYQTDNIMLTMGSDFQYENANAWYKNMDKLMKAVNAKTNIHNIHTLYSTPSCYTYALNKANKTWTTKQQDFFPYSDSPHSVWSGYFVSRVAFKGNERRSNNLFQACKQLHSIAGPQDHKDPEAELETLMRAMGVSQHHDAVTGTAKQHVDDDYTKRLAIGNAHCNKLVGLALQQMMAKDSTKAPTAQFCNYRNISVCPITESGKAFTVTVYNPIAREVTHRVHVPVNLPMFKITGPDGSSVPSQVQPVSDAVAQVRRSRGNATMELIFPVAIPALGYATYQVEPPTLADIRGYSKSLSQLVKPIPTAKNSDTILSNLYLSLAFDGTTGLLKSMVNKQTNTTIIVRQSFYWYNASVGNNESSQVSGAYIFRPNSSTTFDLFDKTVNLKFVNGSLYQEVHQTFNSWVSQIVRLSNDSQHATFEWIIGPIPIKDKLGKEIISRFDTNIDSNDIFYTDSNGRQMMKRQRNHHEDYPYENYEPVAGNYYPINSRIFIKDGKSQLTVMTDRSEGGSSLRSGSLEIMIHRRLLHSDGKGVGEALNETGQFGDGLMVIGHHRVILSDVASAARRHRQLGEEMYMGPWEYYTPAVADWSTHFTTADSFISKPIPENVHLLSMEVFGHEENQMLLRLEHQYEKNEDPQLSANSTVSLQGLFPQWRLIDVTEMTLSANQQLANAQRLQWKIVNSSDLTPTKPVYPPVIAPSFNVTLSPMDIRTFRVNYERIAQSSSHHFEEKEQRKMHNKLKLNSRHR